MTNGNDISSMHNNNLDEENVQVKRVLGMLIDYWPWFLFCIIVALSTSYIYLRYVTPIYKVESELLIEDQEKGGSMFGQSSSVLQDFSSMFDIKSSVDNEEQILQTRDLMKKVAIDLKLYISYFEIGKINKLELYSQIPIKADVLSSLDSVKFSTSIDVIQINDSLLEIKEKVKNKIVTNIVKFDTPFLISIGKIRLYRTSFSIDKNKYFS